MFLFPKLGRIKNETKVPALIKKGVIFPKLAKLYSRKGIFPILWGSARLRQPKIVSSQRD